MISTGKGHPEALKTIDHRSTSSRIITLYDVNGTRGGREMRILCGVGEGVMDFSGVELKGLEY